MKYYISAGDLRKLVTESTNDTLYASKHYYLCTNQNEDRRILVALVFRKPRKYRRTIYSAGQLSLAKRSIEVQLRLRDTDHIIICMLPGLTDNEKDQHISIRPADGIVKLLGDHCYDDLHEWESAHDY